MSAECEEIRFPSQGVSLVAGFWRPGQERFRNAQGRPCIVMAHGLGGTRAAGLEPYARRFAEAGFFVLCFDYRGFGLSEGTPRQLVNVRMQLEDWASAIAQARALPGVDPQRIALWGSSFSGAHSIAAAVADGRVAATSNQGSLMNGLASFLFLLKAYGPWHMGRVYSLGVLDAVKGALGLPRVTVPVVGDPGSNGLLVSPDARPGYHAIAPPDWNDAVTLSWVLSLPLYRANRLASRLHCPALFCIAEKDSIVPPAAVEDAARRAGARAEVRRYPVGHFDIYVGEAFEQACKDQLDFFSRHLKA